MKYPVYYDNLECPHCEGPVYIPMHLAADYWLNSNWMCPHCENTVKTDQWKETDFVQSSTQNNKDK